MIVDHARRLHEGVYGGRPDEAKAFLLESLRECRRMLSLRGDVFECRHVVLDWLTRNEAPDKMRERRVLRQGQICLRIVDRRFDLEFIAHDAGVPHEAREILSAVASDTRGIEIMKGAAKVFALSQYRQPREAGLKAFENHFFK